MGRLEIPQNLQEFSHKGMGPVRTSLKKRAKSQETYVEMT